MATKSYVTYAISDPRTNSVVYVGQASSFEKRKRQHLRLGARRPNLRKQNIKTWLFDTISQGVIPEFTILEEVASEELSLISELQWVKKLKSEGHPLLNKWSIHQEKAYADDTVSESDKIQRYLANRNRGVKRKPKLRDTSSIAEFSNMKWLPAEDQNLLSLYEQGMGGEEIAARMRRPFRGVCARLVRLGAVASRKQVRP